jgi:hypothetical protein
MKLANILIFAAVKLFFCLFSVYILVLSAVPCRADDDSTPCSPFVTCACGCCHGFPIPESGIDMPISEQLPVVHSTVYKAHPLPDFTANIWQPPKAA